MKLEPQQAGYGDGNPTPGDSNVFINYSIYMNTQYPN